MTINHVVQSVTKIARNFTLLTLGIMSFSWLMWYLEVEHDLPAAVSVGAPVALRISFLMSIGAMVCAMTYIMLRRLYHGQAVNQITAVVVPKRQSVPPFEPWQKEIEELTRLKHFYESQLDRATEPRQRLKYLQKVYRLNGEIADLRKKREATDNVAPTRSVN